LFYNLLSASSAIVAGTVTYFLLDFMEEIVPYALAVAAASFLYIALADLIPEMHKETKAKESVLQFLLILVGVGVIFLSAASHGHVH